MYLLYCNENGIVVAIHEDTAVVVPMTAYPNAVRIIPYDQPLSTLPREGEPPPPPPLGTHGIPQVDHRPFRQPDPTPDILKLYAGQCRFNLTAGGFTFNAASGEIPIWTDRQSYMHINGLAEWSTSVPNTTVVNFTQGGTIYALKAGECKALHTAYTENMQRARTAEANCIMDLDSATPTLTTYEQVDEAFEGAVASRGEKAERPLPRII